MVFYRVYRPQKFADLVGQEPIAKTLLSQLETGKIGHGYLFYGPKGTGKTSTARILAKAVNCEAYRLSGIVHRDKKKTINDQRSMIHQFGEPCNRCQSCLSIIDGSNLDLIEIDAASNRGIDEIRDLKEKIKLSPILGRFKVYIIDEAHMLTPEAFNALLKTLEEPPAHAIFILCTTEPDKLPQTIVSRLARFNFKRAKASDLVVALSKIAKAEKIKVEKEALFKIAESADGSFRDAISTLDQISASSLEVSAKAVERLIVGSSSKGIFEFVDLLASSNLKKSVMFVEELSNAGADISFFVKQTVLFLEKLLFLKIGVETIDLDTDQIETMQKLADKFELASLQVLMRTFLQAESEIKFYPLPQIPLVLAVCKFIGQEAGNQEEVLPPFVPQVGTSDGKQVSQPKADSPLGEKVSKANEGGEDQEKPGAKAKFKAGSISTIEKKWPEFLNRVKALNIHVLALLKSTKLVRYESGNIIVEVFYRFHKDKLEEPKIIAVLDSLISEVMKSNINFKFVLAKRDAKAPKAVSRSDVVDVDKEDIIQVAQEIFSK